MAEFDLIENCFMPLAGPGAGGLLDDAAVLDIPAGMQLVVSSDTSNRGDHFVDEYPAKEAAKKCLRSNLSDLTAMGADLFCYQLNLALPKDIEEGWLRDFAAGLAEDQAEFGITLSGGDTTGMIAGGLSVSITAMGLVPKGKAVSRGGARRGDLVVLTGPLGDACLNRLHLARPPCALAPLIREYARAAIDISDGLPADLGHICEVSGVAAKVNLHDIPFSDAVRSALDSQDKSMEDVLTWGEDYELVLAVAADQVDAFQAGAEKLGVDLSVIGEFEEGAGVALLDEDGVPLALTKAGWQHF